MRIWTGLFLMAVMFTAAREAAAVEVGVSVGSRRHGTGGSFEFRTGDSHYNTWYPSSSTYVYTQPSHTTTTYVTPSYTYTTPSVGYTTWYGSDRYRSKHHHHHHHHNHRRDRDRDHNHHHRR